MHVLIISVHLAASITITVLTAQIRAGMCGAEKRNRVRKAFFGTITKGLCMVPTKHNESARELALQVVWFFSAEEAPFLLSGQSECTHPALAPSYRTIQCLNALAQGHCASEKTWQDQVGIKLTQ